MNIQVQKKNGAMEPFDRSKIIGGLIKSGASVEEAENVVTQVEAWVQTAAQNGIIASLELRAKILEFLKVANPIAGAAFESYQKPQPEAQSDQQPQV